MKDNRLGGVALIIGAISGMITMSLHPVAGSHPITPAQFEKLTMLMIGVHALAIAGVPFSFLGALALMRRLDSPGRIALAGLVIYGVGLVAVMIAPAMSGLVGTEVLRHLIARGPENEQWRILAEYNFLINQAFAQIFVVASSAAIALWSFMIVKNRALSVGIGIYGLVLGPAVVIALLTGGLRLDVHGFGLIIFGQAIWFIVVGILLQRSTSAPALAGGTEHWERAAGTGV